MLALACAVAVLGAGPFEATARASHKVLRNSFTAQALPVPSPSAYTVYGKCLGAEGVDLVSRRFKAPWDGSLIADISSSLGGWILKIEAVTGAEASYSHTLAYTREITHDVPLRKGEEVDIIACNYRGLPEAEVNYEFRHRPYPQRPITTEKRVSRSFDGTYYTPVLGTVIPVRHDVVCIGWAGVGCVATEVGRGERFITKVEVSDLASDEVSLVVWHESWSTGAYREDYVCSKLDQPIELVRDADYVGVSPVVGPCIDGTPAMATTGEIEIVLSSTPR